MALVDVWIAQPGNACRVDDHPWTVTIFDAHANIFVWSGIKYADLAAPQGHWAGKLPPGTYVVQATSSDTGVSTDHAVIAVDCNDATCIRLFVRTKGEQPPSSRCQMKIDDAVGLMTDPNSTDANTVRVTGTAQNCKEIQVVVTCKSGKGQTVAGVQADGSWVANVNIKGRGCRCGEPFHITGSCVENQDCKSDLDVPRLRCKRE